MLSKKFLSFLSIIFGLLGLTGCIQVDLFNTVDDQTMEWKKHNTGKEEWKESSATRNGQTIRGIGVCPAGQKPQSTWIRSPFIKRRDAIEATIEIQFLMRRCSQCKQSFSLLVYEADDDIANSEIPEWKKSSWNMIKQVPGTKLYEDKDSKTKIWESLNKESFKFRPRKGGFYIAIQEEGTCTFLLTMRIFYEMCPNGVTKLARFLDTTSSAIDDTPIKVTGQCIENSVPLSFSPTMYCSHQGKWYDIQGECVCKEGYMVDTAPRYCKMCPVGKYKPEKGNSICISCPAYSESTAPGSRICQCKIGYYRNKKDDDNMSCTRPPSEPRNLQMESVDQRQAVLTWLPPEDNGRSDLYYKVVCHDCGASVSYEPSNEVKDTRVTLNNLDASSDYRIIVYALNGVSEQAGQESMKSTLITVRTSDALPGRPENVKVTKVEGNKVTLGWKAPQYNGTSIEHYEIQFVNESDPDARLYTLKAEELEIEINDLEYDTQYTFKVRANTSLGWGQFSTKVSVRTVQKAEGRPNGGDGNVSNGETGIIAGSAVAVLLLLVMLAVMIAIFLRRNRQGCNEKSASDCDALQYSNGEAPYPTLMQPDAYNSRVPRSVGPRIPFVSTPKSRTYVDPHTYEDPNEAIREFAKEIDVSFITIEEVIGGGEFGDVCKGKFRIPAMNIEKEVAIKTLKPDGGDKARSDMLAEASIMGQFDDPNIVSLEGVVTRSNPIMIVTEYMRNGSLDKFLQQNDGMFTILQLIGMMRGVASGMVYLSHISFVHRDLAARNILVNENLVCKVSDFGLSRELEMDRSDYTTKGGKIPVRWTAPEAISYRKFTSSSDVWSFGVVMWEILTYGERPYWSWSNQDVIKAVEEGFRLPPTMSYCPKILYELMLDCWRVERSERPKFIEIVNRLDNLSRNPYLMDDGIAISAIDIDPDHYISPLDLLTVEEWLRSLNLERYTNVFISNGYTQVCHCLRLNHEHLLGLGIVSAVHRKKMLDSLRSPDGYIV